ncbi:unnamed protein product [Protopolystoma xenopodis]|uniref:alpha-1,2-Mannosidase n=1 Tax=Protopolystoma xenopodis TaxID=117903 RepID=A0A448XFD6_9PLAT|nr:unnamed protein product [Protopolystoma xenopodis]
MVRAATDGVFYNFINPLTKSWCQRHVSLAGLGDSFYEYLLKEWLRTGHRDTEARRLYDLALDGFLRMNMLRPVESGHLFITDFINDRNRDKMDHLACFAGGLFALGANSTHDAWFKRGIEVTNTCRKSYTFSACGLGPDAFWYTNDVKFVGIGASDNHYYLRPETVESYFYLWRLTKDQKYRDWGYDVIQALEKYSFTGSGYSGLLNVYSFPLQLDDVQQSFFLAETLKYLYLLYSEDTLLPLDRWVFNTEAHPFPIYGKVLYPFPK